MDEQQRRTRRAFIRAHHPDIGGDSARFVAGLAAFDRGETSPTSTSQNPVARVFVVADKPWPVSVVTAVLRRLERSRRPPRVK